jgi:hypothetical protein
MNCSICNLPTGNIVGSVLPQCMCGWQKPNPPVVSQQRTWVGLPHENFIEACQIAERGNYLVAFQRIQVKLKELNT